MHRLITHLKVALHILKLDDHLAVIVGGLRCLIDSLL